MAGHPVKKKRREHSPSSVRKYWWLVPVLGGVGMIGWVAIGPRWSRAQITQPGGKPLEGYVTDSPKLTEEYRHFYGKALNNSDVEKEFDAATVRMSARDFPGAVGLLEQVSKVAAVPVVFNNLGVLYAELNDKSLAINAFREALARDIDYRAVRLNLARMKGLMAVGADPVSHEAESNDNMNVANIIVPGKAVDADIAAAVNDVDFFRITTPPAPRDMISIEITNRSSTLIPVLKVFDEERRITEWGKAAREPGSSLKQIFSPPANATLYLQVSGYGSSAGAYTLLVQKQKSCDSYEPNDDIYNASRITLGTPIDANIMDANDTDYFSFVSPRTGTVSVVITNRSTTLIPALSTFHPDKRSSGFGPDVRTPGYNLRHTMEVQENQIYFVQVWSQANTSGNYTLLIE
jgi:hypothetical protein